MASVITTEFVKSNYTEASPFSLLEQKGLVSRLIEEVTGAARELARNPRGFIEEILSPDTKDSKRRQRIYLGLSFALIVHVALLTLLAVVGWRTVFVKQVEDPPGYRVVFTKIPEPEPKTESNQPDQPRGESKGGGGGGQHSPQPPSKGVAPPMRPMPPIVNLNPSNIPEPTLAVLPNVVGPESPPPPPAPIGDPNGKKGEFSGGPGDGGGIGGNKGTGVGEGNGAGAGPGERGGKGGKTAGSPEGSSSSVPAAVDFNRISSLAGYKGWSWIYRPTPVVTPEAREHQAYGNVLMRATFNANGTISDIELVMPVEFMTESAIESLKHSTFRPATINGVPITLRKVPIKVFVHY
jgi:periplasmic protein TonB